MASRGDMKWFIMEVTAYNFFYTTKPQKNVKKIEMKICVNYIIMNIGTSKTKDVINKKI